MGRKPLKAKKKPLTLKGLENQVEELRGFIKEVRARQDAYIAESSSEDSRLGSLIEELRSLVIAKQDSEG